MAHALEAQEIFNPFRNTWSQIFDVRFLQQTKWWGEMEDLNTEGSENLFPAFGNQQEKEQRTVPASNAVEEGTPNSQSENIVAE